MEADSDRPHLSIFPFYLGTQLFTACLIALALRGVSRIIGSAALLYIVASVYGFTTGNAQRDYSIGTTFAGQALNMFLLTWLTDPIHEFRHERDVVAPTELPFVRRVWWALCLLNNPRGIGWSCEVSNLPPRPSEARWQFVRKKLLSAFRWFLFIDLAQIYQRSNPLFSSWDIGLWSRGYLMLPVNIVVHFSSLIGMLTMCHALVAAISVTAGIFQPRDWPEMYGCWSDAYTVRRFWGRTYHQTLRRLTTGFGNACCRALGLKPGTWQSHYSQLYVGFAVSGLLHCGGDLMVDPSGKLFGASFPLFFSQALAITFEDAVVRLVRHRGFKVPLVLARAVGYIWVITWLCISTPWQINWTLRAGLNYSEHIPVSLVNHIMPSLGVMAERLAAMGPLGMKAES